ncbi:MAG: hypothetical protein Q9222_007558 [Ikaeria aurantiellina]
MSTISPEQLQYYEEHASDDRRPNMLAAAICGLILSYLAVALRFFARRTSATQVGLDDWLILAALIPLTGYFICACLAVHFGEGRHIIFVSNVEGFVQVYTTTIVAYSLCVVLTKVSILTFYNRIFPSDWLKRASWAIGLLTAGYNLALILVGALECIPLSTLWTHKPGGTCIDTVPPFTALAVINVVTDFLILALPVKFVWNLHMRRTRKIQVCGIFLLGGLVCVFGLVRAVAVGTASGDDPSYLTSSTSGNQVYSGIWSNLEIDIGVVAACLPTLGVLFSKKKLAPSTVTSSSSKKGLFDTIRSKLSLSSRHSTQVTSTKSDKMTMGSLSRRGQKVWSDTMGTNTTATANRTSSEHEFAKEGEFDVERGSMDNVSDAPSRIRHFLEKIPSTNPFVSQMDPSQQPAATCGANAPSEQRPPSRTMDIDFVLHHQSYANRDIEPDTVAGATCPHRSRISKKTEDEIAAVDIDALPRSAEEEFWHRDAMIQSRDKKSRFIEHTNSIGIYEDNDDDTARAAMDPILEGEEMELEDDEKENLERGSTESVSRRRERR